MPRQPKFTERQWREAFAQELGNQSTANWMIQRFRRGCSASMVFRARRNLGVPANQPTPKKVRTLEAVWLIAHGWDATRLRRRFRCDRDVFYRLATVAKLRIRRDPVRYPDWSEVDRLLRAGMRVRDVARATRRNRETITARRRAIGIAKRSRRAIHWRHDAPPASPTAASPGVPWWDCLAPHAKPKDIHT